MNRKLITEQINIKTINIDKASSHEIVRMINNEDKSIAFAVEKEIRAITKAIDVIAQRIMNNGRLIYVGAGTSGRLGVLDAIECIPTFGLAPGTVIGILAGGINAFIKPAIASEDDEDLGRQDLKDINVNSQDIVVGVSASGHTPYVIGAIKEAISIGAKTICLVCNKNSPLSTLTDIEIAPVVGPEVIAGSTRMKAGTAQKMVLNMLSTGAMIRIGKTYKNLMVDVKPSNKKLMDRSVSILSEITGLEHEESRDILIKAGWEVKTAIIVVLIGISIEEARASLEKYGGKVRMALSGLMHEGNAED